MYCCSTTSEQHGRLKWCDDACSYAIAGLNLIRYYVPTVIMWQSCGCTLLWWWFFISVKVVSNQIKSELVLWMVLSLFFWLWLSLIALNWSVFTDQYAALFCLLIIICLKWFCFYVIFNLSISFDSLKPSGLSLCNHKILLI